jgi:hypothetical protein
MITRGIYEVDFAPIGWKYGSDFRASGCSLVNPCDGTATAVLMTASNGNNNANSWWCFIASVSHDGIAIDVSAVSIQCQ